MYKGGIAALAAFVLAGCTSAQPAQPQAGPVESASASAPTPASSADAQMSVGPSDLPSVSPSYIDELVGQVTETGETIDPGRVPEWDAASVHAAVERATLALEAFAQPDLEHDEWWAQFGPHLTTDAQHVYVYVAPENIPVREVTGPGIVTDQTSVYIAVVDVPTDIGTYRLTLQRLSADDPWLVVNLDPPSQ